MKPLTSDPWSGLSRPAGTVLGRRWASPHPLEAYWAVHPSGAPGLVLRGIPATILPEQLPRPRGMTVTGQVAANGLAELQLFLESQQDREVFLRLCEDLLVYSAQAADARSSTAALIERLRRWQALLSVSRGPELPEHEVRGLFGELHVLADLILPHWGVEAALRAWTAPDRSPQDFQLPTTLVEVKARLQEAESSVNISSLEQLDASGRNLHLLVVRLAASQDNPGSRSLNDQAAALVAAAEAVDIGVGDLARDQLKKRGYAPSPSYDSWRYVVRGVDAYAVRGAFPRLTPGEVPAGVREARYVLDTNALQDYTVDAVMCVHP